MGWVFAHRCLVKRMLYANFASLFSDSMKRFFEMTRHERRGTVVLLVLILVLVSLAGIMRCHRGTAGPVNTEDVRRFEAEVDSFNVSTAGHRSDSTGSAAKKPSKKPRRHSSPRRPAADPSRSPRPLDPVPQF